MSTASHKVVVTDANVLINLMHVQRLYLCTCLPGFEFVVPDQVREEIQTPSMRRDLDRAIETGELATTELRGLEQLELFLELTKVLGRGESACLALAIRQGWLVASDEKRRFRREVEKHIGLERLLGTADIYRTALRAGVLTLEEAEADKVHLAHRRFRMDASFREAML